MARPESMGLILWEGDREPHPQGGERRHDGRGAEGRWLAEAAADKGLLLTWVIRSTAQGRWGVKGAVCVNPLALCTRR